MNFCKRCNRYSLNEYIIFQAMGESVKVFVVANIITEKLEIGNTVKSYVWISIDILFQNW